jgi:hypothetical protein
VGYQYCQKFLASLKFVHKSFKGMSFIYITTF